jgi:hypothetical protein
VELQILGNVILQISRDCAIVGFERALYETLRAERRDEPLVFPRADHDELFDGLQGMVWR